MNKLAIALSTSAILASAAFAGGPDYPIPPKTKHETPSIYFEANVGYARANWSDNYGALGVTMNNPTGGFIWGVDGGFNWTKNLALEAGYWKPDSIRVKNANGAQLNYFETNIIYAVMKYNLPIMHKLNAFAKLGPAFYLVTANPTNNSRVHNLHDVQLMAAAGFDYHFTKRFFANATYTFINGTGNENTAIQPPINMVTGGLGVQFAL